MRRLFSSLAVAAVTLLIPSRDVSAQSATPSGVNAPTLPPVIIVDPAAPSSSPAATPTVAPSDASSPVTDSGSTSSPSEMTTSTAVPTPASVSVNAEPPTPPQPSAGPSPQPASRPSPQPISADPLPQPTSGPSPQPTVGPTPALADAPDDSSPTRPPTQRPTSEPTSRPATDSPTVSPTSRPTFMPALTSRPTPESTTPPPAATTTAPPTIPPSPAIVEEAPNTAPAVRSGRVSDLSLVLEGLPSKLSTNNLEIFQRQTSQYIEDFYNEDNIRRRRRSSVVDSSIQQDLSNVMVNITVTNQALSSGRLLRTLRQQSNGNLVITYDQRTTYNTTNTSVPMEDIVTRPFDNEASYIEYLQAGGTTAFDSVRTVRGPYSGEEAADASSSSSTQQEGTTTTDSNDDSLWIIIAAVCGVVGLVLLMLGCWWCCTKRRDDERYNKGDAKSTYYGEEDEKPPTQLQLSTLGGPDEVSTLAEPMPRLGVMTSNESLAGFEDQSTIGSVDYDYSRAYGGDTSVSSAGGTLGSGPRGGGQSRASGGDTIATPALTSGGQSIFSDDASFERHYRDQDKSLKQTLIHVLAPPGKLGVVIDTPDDGAPVVHAIKDSSPIADKIKVGDKLIAVDDENVEAMTAIRVSKLISRKSANAQRKLSVIRTTVVEQ